ncbi:hypothetical protein SPBR_02151 [Sporothrix brasiliensis 5110]|uniref:Uncharacterized protein n=1 Tax=Sporothrix brasiliensis 5110 TaxID=1398154 RepID=A0A0C2FJR8_9PEZI|nr:uncharacterized protein SPBR_02151 [Sporothrix brasiliensis 5110]KIH91273.1 hypothetical protein SPBR_02151 [Sporothrix brasiliensis 5110]
MRVEEVMPLGHILEAQAYRLFTSRGLLLCGLERTKFVKPKRLVGRVPFRGEDLVYPNADKRVELMLRAAGIIA